MIAAGVMAVVLTTLSVGCAGNGGSSVSPASHSLKTASAIDLRAADLPGLKVAPTKRRVPLVSQSLRCAEFATEPEQGAESATFVHQTRPEWWVSSSVAVLPSKADAVDALALLTSERGQACLVRSVAGNAAFVHVINSSALPVPGLPSGGARRMFLQLQNPRPSRMHLDVILFAAGRTLAGLIAQSGALAAPPATEQRLAELMYRRATVAQG
jgi:hypothetical protein